ncbi:unnamed protein product [Calypogeia fissa]
MARRVVRRARPPRYIWQNPPMADRRSTLWLLQLGLLMSVVWISSEARTLTTSPGQAAPLLLPLAKTVPKEALAMLDLRISLNLRDDEEWPEQSDPCANWKGVSCEEGHVVEVILSGLNAATLPHKARPESSSSSSIDALQQLPWLRSLNVSGFSLLGPLPVWLGGLSSLEVMDFMSASLTGSIPSSIGLLCNLKILRLANNSLTGIIPPNVGDLKRLTLLDLSSNKLEGLIPESLGSLEGLKELNLSVNRLQGMVPSQLGGLAGLQRLSLGRNDLVGPIPSQLGTLVHLDHLDLSSNSLVGSIPADLGRLVHLTVLDLSDNLITGAIPSEITNCSHLRVLLLSHNSLTGTLPNALGKLRNLTTFNLSSNILVGGLFAELSELIQLQSMNLSNNLFSGAVPDAISRLERLTVLDLSGNHFSGDLPKLLTTLQSQKRVVFLSRNCFSSPYLIDQRSPVECSNFYMGTVASFPNRSPQRMLLQITPPGPINSSSGDGNSNHLAAILAGVFAVVALIVLVAIAVFYILQYERKAETKRKERRAAEVQRSAGSKAARKALNIPSGRSINVTRLGEEFSYAQLQMATGGFDLSNMIMAGHTGDLYKGVLNGSHVVVKRIDVGRFRKDVYMSELEFLGRVSHPRLVPLLGYCLEREDEKLLVYKYMPNGDLAYALHRKESPSRPEEVLQSLDWITRLKIAIGVAEGLVYLHHECSPPLVHRDVKASSILLDDKFEVRLGSLSDARVQQGEHHSNIIGRFLRLSRSSDQLDAGLPLASSSYDVFCFGKVLLELVSGKLGISGSIDPGADAWLDWALPLIDIHDREPLMKLMDPSLIVDEDLMEEVWATAIIAKSCLNPKASRRPNMKHILRALENPQKVVRDDHSGPMKSRHSSYGSWNSALFGGWRHFSSESARFGFQGSLREEHSFELSRGQPPGPSEEPRYHRRPGSREIVPVPLSGPKTGTQDSDETGS